MTLKNNLAKENSP